MPQWEIFEATWSMAKKLKHPDPLEQFSVCLKAPAGLPGDRNVKAAPAQLVWGSNWSREFVIFR
jgi:hypothetical protein